MTFSENRGILALGLFGSDLRTVDVTGGSYSGRKQPNERKGVSEDVICS